MKETLGNPAPAAPDSAPGHFAGLLWSEWFAHSRLLLVFLALWLVSAWVVPLYTHPGWIMVVSFMYALIAGPAYGGSDAFEDCEEFTFALPSTRAERFWARWCVAGFTLLMFIILDFLVLGLDWGTTLKRFYLEAGWLEASPELKPGLLYGLILALPAHVFCVSFVLSSVVRRRFVVFTSWFWSVAVAMATLYAGLLAEEWLFGEIDGSLSFPALGFGSVLAMVAGHRLYRFKEVGHYGEPVTLPPGFWLWLALAFGALATLVLVTGELIRRFPQFFDA